MYRLTIAISAAVMLSACGSETAEEVEQAAGEAKEEAKELAAQVAQNTQAGAEELSESASEVMKGTEAALDDASTAAQDVYQNVGESAEEIYQEASQVAREAYGDASEAAGDALPNVGALAREAAAEVGKATAATAAALGIAGATAAAAADDGDDCTLGIEVGDNIAYSTDSLTVPASCDEVTLTITHTGQLPAVAMGHNWVLLPADALDAVARAGMAAGADADYVPDDDRIVAATSVVGGGESASVSFSLGALQDGVTYRFVCTFPGHSAVMQGSFTVSG